MKNIKNENEFGTILINDFQELEKLSKIYNIPVSELLQMDLNRCGIYLPNGEVQEKFRVRFKTKILDDYETWVALPVRSKDNTPYYTKDNKIYFKNCEIGLAKELELDTCDTSYQRGPYLLNLNSRSRSSCGGCKACIHNYHDLYNSTVIKDRLSLNTKEDIENYFIKMKFDIKKFNQLAVVTGLFRDEDHVVNHMKLVHEVANEMGFNGELMYFGCQVNSDKALIELSKLENFYLIYALDNFSKRDMLLSKLKSSITIEDAKDTLTRAKKLGIKTSISYICGIDNLNDMIKGFENIKESLTSFPIINIYQMQTIEQSSILYNNAKSLDLYIKSRIGIEELFKDTSLRPKRWENYRPLWYKYFSDEELPNNSFGQLEKNGE
ncbi:MAG: hypothetical protein RR500_01760 [Bacilli bacterium]